MVCEICGNDKCTADDYCFGCHRIVCTTCIGDGSDCLPSPHDISQHKGYKTRHTRGPWVWVENGNGQKCLETTSPMFTNCRILRCAKGAGPFTPDKQLIAAAPDLLAACKAALARDTLEDWQRDQITAAVAKAEGKEVASCS